MTQGIAAATAELSERQRDFVRYLVETGQKSRAAELAGYAEPATSAYQLLQNPRVQKALADATQARLQGTISLALRTLETIADDSSAPAAARVSAAKELLDRAGVIAPERRNGNLEAELVNMPLEHLHRMVASIEAQRAAAAKPVSAPVPASLDAKAIDIFD